MATIRFSIRRALSLTALVAVWSAAFSAAYSAGYEGVGYEFFLVQFAMPFATCAILCVMTGERPWFVIILSVIMGILGAALWPF